MITNYGELQAAIRGYLYNRKDLDANILTFINLAEKKLFRELRAPENEKLALFTVPDGQNIPSITEPDDFLEIKMLTVNGCPVKRVSEITLKHLLGSDNAGGLPAVFGRILKEYIFWRIPDSNYDVELLYWTDYSDSPLTVDDDTNPILLEYPDLYLYGALIEAMPFLADDQRLGTWSSMYTGALETANNKTVEQEYSGHPSSVSSVYADPIRGIQSGRRF